VEIQHRSNKTILIVSLLFVLALLIGSGTLGYFWYRKLHQPAPASSSKGGTISLDTVQKVETEPLQTALAIPKSTDKPGDSIKLSVLSMTVPKAWRTLNARNLLNTPPQSVYAASSNDILAQLIMVAEQNPPDPTLATNNFGLYNITAWLKQSSVGSNGVVTPAMKSAYIANVENLASGGAGDKNACNKGAGVLNVTVCESLLKPSLIATADGALKGIAYLTMPADSYDPQAYVMLTGQLKDQHVFGYGAFHLLDRASHQLDAQDANGIKAARDAVLSGNVPSDTLQLYQHVIDAIKSINIQVNE